MTTNPDREPTLADLAEKLDKLTADVENLSRLPADVENLGTELSQTQKWQDRTWDVVKWVGGISAGLAISAAIALVGIVLRLAAIGQ